MKKFLISLVCAFSMLSMQVQPIMAIEESEEGSTEVEGDTSGTEKTNMTEEDSSEGNEDNNIVEGNDQLFEGNNDSTDSKESEDQQSENEEEPSDNNASVVNEDVDNRSNDSVSSTSEEDTTAEEVWATAGDANEGSDTPSYTEIQMYRLYNPNSGEHFYTGSYEEYDHLWNLGWEDEGIGWVAPSYSNYPVYRLYNRSAGEHHFTMSATERDWLVSLGWTYECIGWYSADPSWSGASPLYRQYNPNAFANNHNYTLSSGENDWLVSLGWRAEGIGWYAVSNYSASATRVHPKVYTPTYYSQRDPRWSGITYNGYSLYSTGCVPTSIAMVVDGILGNGVTPNVMADYLVTTGEFAGRKHGGSGLAIKYGAEHWGLSTTGINSYETLVNCLNRGDLVVFQVGAGTFTSRGSTHAIVLFRNSGGNTCVYDPWNAHNGWYSISMIWNQRSTNSYDLTGGYVGYGINK